MHWYCITLKRNWKLSLMISWDVSLKEQGGLRIQKVVSKITPVRRWVKHECVKHAMRDKHEFQSVSGMDSVQIMLRWRKGCIKPLSVCESIQGKQTAVSVKGRRNIKAKETPNTIRAISKPRTHARRRSPKVGRSHHKSIHDKERITCHII